MCRHSMSSVFRSARPTAPVFLLCLPEFPVVAGDEQFARLAGIMPQGVKTGDAQMLFLMPTGGASYFC